MFQWVPYAFVRIVIFFMAGILFGIYQPYGLGEKTATWLLVGLVILFFVVAVIRWRNLNPGFIGLIALSVAGYLNVLHKTDSRSPAHFIHELNSIVSYKAVITKPVEEKANSWKQEARVLAIRLKEGGWKEVEGKVLLYFSKKDFSGPFHYGDEILIRDPPRELEPPANPGEFDYKRFLTFRKIYHQHFLNRDDVQWVGNNPPNRFMQFAVQARYWAQATLDKHVVGEREQAMASALVLGVTDGLDNELLNAYSATGAMHVLAVSGLHVGILYWIMLFVLKPFNKNRSGKWVLAIVSIFVLWGYAFVTGLSPSVLRAVVMFSFVALARPLDYKTNIYNILAASAFCLLVYEPYLIMSVGFQLSYLAVLGIVCLQPGLYRLWEPTRLLWDKVWQITCVSIAAQITTFALGLLYFHQFPVYFLFSNLFVIPGSFIVLVLGIVLLGVSAIAWLAQSVGFLLTWSIKALNLSVFLVEDLPFGLIDGVYITTFQCWLVMGMVTGFIAMIQYRKFRYLLMVAGCVAFFVGAQWVHYYQEVKPQKFVVYKVSGHTAFEFLDQGKSYFFADSTLQKNPQRIGFHIQPNRLENGVYEVIGAEESPFLKRFESCQLASWNDKLFLHVYGSDFKLPDFRVDYVIVSNNAVRDLSRFSEMNFSKLIIDSSNTRYLSTKLLDQAKSLTFGTYSVHHSGAFVTRL